MTPEEEIVYLEGVRAYVNSRIKKLKEKQYNDKRPKLGGHRLAFSGLFIQAECLIPYIQKAVDNGDSATAIAERAMVSNTTVSNILIRKHTWMREEIADKILMALDLPHVFNELEKVRLKRKVQIVEPPESQYFEE